MRRPGGADLHARRVFALLARYTHIATIARVSARRIFLGANRLTVRAAGELQRETGLALYQVIDFGAGRFAITAPYALVLIEHHDVVRAFAAAAVIFRTPAQLHEGK